MTIAQIKSEINSVVNHIPDQSLEEALKLLKDFQEQSERKTKRAKNFKKIVSDNYELLQKLAQ